MNKTIQLTKILMKNGYKITGIDDDNKTKKFLLMLILLVALIPAGFGCVRFLELFYETLALQGAQGLILWMAFGSIFMMIMLFGVIYILNVFYFNEDIEDYLFMPIEPKQILIAKFLVVLIYEYLITSFFYFPLIIVFGTKGGLGLFYYLSALIVFLALPVVPLTIAGIIDMMIMKVTNIGRNKDFLKVTSALLAIATIMAINIFAQKMASSNLTVIAQDSISNVEELLSGFKFVLPSIYFATNALMAGSLLLRIVSLLGLIAVTATFFWIFIVIGNKLYLKGVIGLSQSNSSGKTISDKQFDKTATSKSKYWSFAVKELRFLFRTPAYLLNCVLITFLLPIMLMLPLAVNPDSLKDLKVIGMLLQEGSPAILLAVIFSSSIIFSAFNSVAATTISREGKDAFIMMYLPVRYSDILLGKIAAAMFMGFISNVLILGIFIFILKLNTLMIAASIVLVTLGTMFSCLIGVIFDLNFPKLDWDNEFKVVKQNLTSIMAISVCGGIGFLCGFGLIKLELNPMASFIFIVSLFTFINLVLIFVIKKNGLKLLKKAIQK